MRPARAQQMDRGYLTIDGVGHLPSATVLLGPATYATRGWPNQRAPDLTEQTRRAIGEFAFRDIQNPTIVVRTSGQPVVQVPNDEDAAVTGELHWCLVGLAIATRYSVVTGVTGKFLCFPGSDPLRPSLSDAEHWCSREPGPIRVAVDWEVWPTLCVRLRELVARPLGETESLISSLRSFWRATQQNQVDDRYELFCRSIETVLQLRRGEGAPDFARGVAAILGLRASDRRLRRLAEHYQRRSDVVHGNRFLQAGRDHRAIGAMELIARRFIRRVILDEALTEEFIAHFARRRAERAAR